MMKAWEINFNNLATSVKLLDKMNVGPYLQNHWTLHTNQPNKYISLDSPKPDCSLSFISCGGIEFSNTLMVCIWQPLKVPLIFKRLPASNNKWYAMHLTHWLNLKKGFWNRQPFVKAHWFQCLREGTDFQSKIQMACQAIMQSRFHLSIDAKTLNSSTFTNPLKPGVTYQFLWKLESFGLSVAKLEYVYWDKISAISEISTFLHQIC